MKFRKPHEAPWGVSSEENLLEQIDKIWPGWSERPHHDMNDNELMIALLKLERKDLNDRHPCLGCRFLAIDRSKAIHTKQDWLICTENPMPDRGGAYHYAAVSPKVIGPRAACYCPKT